jgi:hypothetical protein
MVMSAVSLTDGSPLGLSPVLPVSSPGERPGRLFGVGVVTVAVFARLPVAFAAILPRISTLAVAFAGRSRRVTDPVHGRHIAPPSVEYCGACTLAGTLSFTVGAWAVEGPEFTTVIV